RSGCHHFALPWLIHGRGSPEGQSIEGGPQRCAALCHGVDDRTVGTAAHLTNNQTVVLQLLQARRQKVRRNARKPAGDVGITPRTDQQITQDQQCPTLAENLGRSRQPTVLAVSPLRHDSSIPLDYNNRSTLY